ncbi:sugar transferase [Curtobacterium sp. MCSS17_008]|uniref:sugar transferase n=1 Tax=Curtobacterium sp. MCSS17_008 TaxID=2175647 RepID=UPI000DA85584|nr:sugar transferase [Curtobacterium sp. MCSS17_008]PZF57753.1 sugar transferase [Curtobacterium sp. MCSS17_008]
MPGEDWRRRYAFGVAFTDALVLVWTVFGVQIAWLGLYHQASVDPTRADTAVSYTVISLALIVGWMLSLAVFGTRAHRIIGAGGSEYKYVIDASVRLFGVVGILALLLKLDLARGYVLIAFPLGTILLVVSRWLWRQWLGAHREGGRYSAKVLLVGSEQSAAHIANELARQPKAGYRVIAACVPLSSNSTLAGTAVPIIGGVDKILPAMARTGADTVMITSADELSPERVRQLSWELEPGRYHLVVAPSLSGIGGPRIHTRPLVGLPLVHVEAPRYDGSKLYAKRAFDVLLAMLLLIFASPVLAVTAVAVKATSKGPVFYRQERIGKNGAAFHMLKFRSMRVGADDELARLLADQGTSDRPLFKVRHDPRVTRVGAVIRKYSIDELPQLLNVLKGDMSLVGPRPQRAGERALYDNRAERRLLVQPGMTGLWQVSGRSALSWDDAIRLDLYYVENWSLTGDILILFRTIRAVIAPDGTAF